MADRPKGATGSWEGLLGPLDVTRAALGWIGNQDIPNNPYYWQPGDLFAQFMPLLGGADLTGPGGLTGFVKASYGSVQPPPKGYKSWEDYIKARNRK